MNADADGSPLTLVLMAGLPGSGKSTVALQLGKNLGWPVLDKDTLKSALLVAAVGERTAAAASYDLLFALARDQLVEQHLSLILDSPALHALIVERADDLARQAGASLKVVLCVADDARRNERMAARPRMPSQLASDVRVENPCERFRHLPPDRLTLDTTRPLDVLMIEALTYLRG